MRDFQSILETILVHCHSFDAARKKTEQILKWLEKNRVSIIHPESFPESLKRIPKAPAFIFFKGNIDILKQNYLSVVGARQASSYGLASAFRFSKELAAGGLGIVSGLARGIDGASHRGALNGKGSTIAVMGCGLDTIYPKENTKLAHQILDAGGGWLSEHAPFVPPLPHHFPQRNRIISALGMGCLVIEARKKSGSLITALCALDQGKDVFVVPGPIDQPNFEGAHSLIQQGAKLVFSIKDIVEELPLNSFFHLRNQTDRQLPFCFGEKFSLAQWNVEFKDQGVSQLLHAIKEGDVLELAPQRFLSTLPNPNKLRTIDTDSLKK